ncbi:hypothetical protein SNE26_10920 [Mucilaginibacter sp. cycad4]|uniref:fibronectin type III domain-containing protein n=1 Tax=Mucilaginibacter sp. cycad4 TaxID=3342096 RepID=UPI002AAAC928|nr:hypothetical protein [Mucilaginibacter gossypii]WPV02288.1 hypothetical protein SNE26_10920 [Mucilaginibacter gossypii]
MRTWIYSLFIILTIAGCSKKTPPPDVTPVATSLVSPLKDQPCTTGTIISTDKSTVTFTWQTADKAEGYVLAVKNLLTKVETKQTVTSTQATADLLRNTPYSWYVISTSTKTKATAQSETWKFYNAGAGTVSYPPYPAEITAPLFGDNVTASSGNITLKWTGSTLGAAIKGYDIYFSNTNSPTLFKSNISDSQYQVAVKPGTTYYWRIVTIDNAGNYTDSGIYQFSVK